MHEAEQNLVHSPMHNINIYIKHIILLSLEGFYYYSFCIFFLYRSPIALQRNSLYPRLYGDDMN